VHLIPPVLVEIKRRLPKIDLRITSGHTGATLARLIGGEIDLGLLPLPVEPERMRITELGRDELVAAVPPDHCWVARRRVQARDFQDEPVILYDRQSQITELTLGFLLAEGVFPRVAAEIEHLEAVKEMVQRRLGVAVLPAWAIRCEVAAGVLAAVGLGRTGLVRSWGLIYPEKRQLPATFRSLVRLCGDLLPPLLSAGT
ncbi:MAG: LysR family transcriptional regulator substrate-binding protein, partial [Deltaproteobacteria bacterium]